MKKCVRKKPNGVDVIISKPNISMADTPAIEIGDPNRVRPY